MIFVTLGSQKFQFDRLLRKIDELIESGEIEEQVFAQIGCSTYTPKNYKYKAFLDRDEFEKMTEKCTIFLTHGGTGAIMGAVKKGKKVLAVPRLAKYGEHVDDHQLQLLKQFDDTGIIVACYDMDKLGEAYRKVQTASFLPYVSNTQKYISSIGDYVDQENRLKVCLVSSSGGHLAHLYMLKHFWKDKDHFWVTFPKEDANSLLQGEKMYPCYFPTNRSVKALIRNTVLAWKILKKERPDLIISSGAAIAVPFFYVGKLFGAKLIYIEVFDRIDTPTMTGRLIYPIVDKFVVQWDEMRKVYPKAVNLGSIF